MNQNKNDKVRSRIFLMLYLIVNAMSTGAFINITRIVVARRDWDFFHEMTPALMMYLTAMWFSADMAKHHYKKLYKNNQK